MNDATAAKFVVLDMESADYPVFIGWYIRADEDVVVYETLSGGTSFAPADCVKVKEVPSHMVAAVREP